MSKRKVEGHTWTEVRVKTKIENLLSSFFFLGVLALRLGELVLHLHHSNQVTYSLMMHLCKSDTELLHISKEQATRNVISNTSPV